MKQSFIIAAISSNVVMAAPRHRSARQEAKLMNDQAFVNHASKYNVNTEDTGDFL
jgi:hypothetical protein